MSESLFVIVLIIVSASFALAVVVQYLTIKTLICKLNPLQPAEDEETPPVEAEKEERGERSEKKEVSKLSDDELQKELDFIEGRTNLPLKTEGLVARKQRLVIEQTKRRKINKNG